ncbi:unnamed protein product, partial [marine sediment metagenome]
LVDLKKIEAIPLWNERNYHVDKYQIIENAEDLSVLKLPAFEDL